jgi:hypothetical protein
MPESSKAGRYLKEYEDAYRMLKNIKRVSVEAIPIRSHLIEPLFPSEF